MSRFAGKIAPLIAGGLGLALILSGCSRGNDEDPLQLQILKAGKEAFAARKAARTPTPIPTRALLDTVQDPLLEVVLERRDQRAYLYREALRRDASPGQIAVWRTGDNVTLAMRNDVLFSTRGLGGDILSGTAPVAQNHPGPFQSGQRTFDIRAHENQTLRLTLICDLADLGAETIEIIGRSHATRHMRETCESHGFGSPGQVVNDYWIDTRAGLVWQSRQWAGPEAGYLRIRRVSK